VLENVKFNGTEYLTIESIIWGLMEDISAEWTEETQSDSTVNNPTFSDRITVLAAPEALGGIIHPVNPHFTGYNTVINVENEDPDVQWISNPGFVVNAIAEEEATPLSLTDIAAINVEPERTHSTDDDRPASSFSILDRRHYRAEVATTPERIGPVPMAIGSRLDQNDDMDQTDILEAMPIRTQASSSSTLSSNHDEGDESITRRRKKRKTQPKVEGFDNISKKHYKREDPDDSTSNHPPRVVMSGRRHSGHRNRS